MSRVAKAFSPGSVGNVGEGFDILKRTQWGYTSNPNLGAALLVGLGCEAFQIDKMKEAYNLKETDTFQTMTIQEIGGTRKAVGLAPLQEATCPPPDASPSSSRP